MAILYQTIKFKSANNNIMLVMGIQDSTANVIISGYTVLILGRHIHLPLPLPPQQLPR